MFLKKKIDGKLTKIDPETGKCGSDGFEFIDQKHYEELGETITNEVYKLLDDKGLHRIYIPSDIPKEKATFVFSTQEKLEKPDKLLILIHGSGVVRAGQWARSLIMNDCLAVGTQIPYIEKAKQLGYEVLITNTNDNHRIVNGKKTVIPGSGTPEQHINTVWNTIVIPAEPKSVAIVAHSYGGVVTVDLAKKNPDFFKSHVFGIGFTDSVHYFGKIIQDVTRNYIASSKPVGTLIKEHENEIHTYSSGHIKHEYTSHSAIKEVFEFLENNYEEFQNKKSTKKPKLDL